MSLGETRSVIVVGAGISGVACARKLFDAGFSVIMLEARDRIGGRMHSWSFPGDPTKTKIDLGASFVHGIDGNPVTPLANRAGCSLRNLSQHSCYPHLQGHALLPLSQQESARVYAHICNSARRVAEYSARHRENISETEPAQALLIAFLSESLHADPSHVIRSMDSEALARYYEGYNGGALNRLSLKYADADVEYRGDQPLVDGKGYSAIIEMLAKPFSHMILLGHVVIKVMYNGTHASVLTKDGSVFQADFIVVTVPLGVLKSKLITFEPALPQEKLVAIQQLDMGLLDKLVLMFETAFWPDHTDWMTLAPLTSSGPTVAACDSIESLLDSSVLFLMCIRHLDSVNPKSIFGIPRARSLPSFRRASTKRPHRGSLVFFLGNGAAEAMEKLTDAQATEAALRSIRRHFPNAPDPIGSCFTRWRADPFSLGSYSYIPTNGATVDDFDALAASVAATPGGPKRVLMAGEHTSRAHFSTVHGALESGWRAAQEVIDSPP